jgi:predicted nucleic acid-binding protein
LPTSDSGRSVLVDTSVALALLIEGHEHNHSTLQALSGLRLGLAGHAAYETYSVLTRLPPPARRAPHIVARLITVNFPATCYLSSRHAASLIDHLTKARVAGGAVYDALVAETAREHNLPLLTRDRRAVATYRALQVHFEVIE